MTYRTATSQTQHDQIVQAVANHLAQRGYQNIRADLPNYVQPSLVLGTIQNHIPDVTAVGLIVEVETCDSIDGDHTTSQWSLFADHAAKNAMAFWVVVPRGCAGSAQGRLTTLGIHAEVYTA